MNYDWINQRLTERSVKPSREQQATEKLQQVWPALQAAIKDQVSHYAQRTGAEGVTIKSEPEKIIVRQTSPYFESVTVKRSLQPAYLEFAYEKAGRSDSLKVAEFLTGSFPDKIEAAARRIIDPVLFPDLQN
jgi:hypothetical protein